METQTMGRVLVEATIENLEDLWAVKRGLIPADKARHITIADALVDTGATTLALPTRLIEQLGLTKSYEKRAISTKGSGIVALVAADQGGGDEQAGEEEMRFHGCLLSKS